MRVPFVGESNECRSVNVSGERTLNLVPRLSKDGKFNASLHKRPGLATWSSPGSSPVRAELTFGSGTSERLISVVGNAVKSVDSAGVATAIGNITTTSGPVSMDANDNDQVMIVDGTAGWITDGATLTQITDAQFPNGATQVTSMDGYFIVDDPSEIGQFALSDPSAGTAWDATRIGNASRANDALKGVLVNDRVLWLWGEYSTEVFYDAGNPTQPFAAQDSAFTPWGIQAPFSRAAIDSNVLWLAKSRHGDRIVMMAPKGSLIGVRVSTHSLEDQLLSYEVVDDAVAMTMQLAGHSWYILTFPTADKTWVYDLATGFWTEWSSYGLGRWRGHTHAYFAGQHIIGDYRDGNLFTCSFDNYSDAGAVIPWLRIDRAIADSEELSELDHNSFTLEAETGVGSDSLDPIVEISWSDDGGHTYSTPLQRTLGLAGNFKKQSVTVNRCGMSSNRCYKVQGSDIAKVAITSAYANIAKRARRVGQR